MVETTERYQHVVFFSGGVASYLTARRVIHIFGTRKTVLLFCDTHAEDEDLYRFLRDAAADLDCKLISIDDGRTPWKVFHDERCIGSNFKSPCSRLLKRRIARRWLTQHTDPAATTLYLGLAWYEARRVRPNFNAWLPWHTIFPMTDKPHLDRCEMLAATAASGLRPPRLYELGFEHNNCGGACVKAGKANWRLLLEKLPERYAHHEDQEAALRRKLGRDCSVLTTMSDGRRIPYTLEEFRYHCEENPTPLPDDEWGGCDCMTETDDDSPNPNH